MTFFPRSVKNAHEASLSGWDKSSASWESRNPGECASFYVEVVPEGPHGDEQVLTMELTPPVDSTMTLGENDVSGLVFGADEEPNFPSVAVEVRK